MNFLEKDSRRAVPVLLEPRSLLVMGGASRYEWLHGLAARKTDTWGGRTITRGRRLSLTFRKVILAE